MTKIEMHFRRITIAERLRQIEGELAALETECLSADGPIVWREVSALKLASIQVSQAAEELERPDARNLEALLELSIDRVRERRRTKDFGSEVLPKNENAPEGNPERFPKPVIVRLND
jgi:hypothetical protein